jgi:hypothetical protein
MNTPGWGVDSSFVHSRIRTELARLGLEKADLDRRGISVEALAREALRLCGELQGDSSRIVSEIFGRVGLRL